MTATAEFSLNLNSRRAADTSSACLEATFYLYPTDECVHYFLSIESVPNPPVLYVNGQHIREIDESQPIQIDITDYVALEKNTLALRVESSAIDAGDFGEVKLTAVPCEE